MKRQVNIAKRRQNDGVTFGMSAQRNTRTICLHVNRVGHSRRCPWNELSIVPIEAQVFSKHQQKKHVHYTFCHYLTTL